MEGKIGKIFHFKANYYLSDLANPENYFTWRRSKKFAGSGVLGDICSHIIDLARWLCGEPKNVMAINKTFIKERPLENNILMKKKVDVDDAATAIIEFENGAIGYLDSSGMCHGHKEFERIEINGEMGTIIWNFTQMNCLDVYFKDFSDNIETNGFRKLKITDKNHPYYNNWSKFIATSGIDLIGTFINTAYNMVNAIVNDVELSPMIATFKDGYRSAVIIDSILKSAESGDKVKIEYLD